jgi:hypothetical protein
LNGAAGGAATGGDLNIPGQKSNSDTNNAYTQPGGDAFLGLGAAGNAGAGAAASNYGGGGGAPGKDDANLGGNGGAGIVLVWEYK